MSNHLSDVGTEAISRLVAQAPFFATLLYDLLELREDRSIPTAATDGKRVYYNPDFFVSLTPQEREFVLCHEIMHCILQHMPRGELYKQRGFGPDLKPYEHDRMNRAEDYIINAILIDAGIGSMPSMGLHDRNIAGPDDVADEVYVSLASQPPPPPNGPGNGHGGFDEHLPPSSAADAPSEADIDSALAGAKNAAKAMGKMPGGLERLVDEILNPSVDWKEQLRHKIMARTGKDQATWRKLHRRRIAVAPHVAFPGSTGFAMEDVAVVIDTSGSIGQNEISQFLGEVASILDECRPETVHVLWTDSRVAGHDEVHDVEDLKHLKPMGGGGTDMPAAFKYLDDNDIHVELVIVLTDGYTPWGKEPDYDVIWGITTDVEAPYGETIKLDIQ